MFFKKHDSPFPILSNNCPGNCIATVIIETLNTEELIVYSIGFTWKIAFYHVSIFAMLTHHACYEKMLPSPPQLHGPQLYGIALENVHVGENAINTCYWQSMGSMQIKRCNVVEVMHIKPWSLIMIKIFSQFISRYIIKWPHSPSTLNTDMAKLV